MTQTNSGTGFEYQNKHDRAETPFETFLRHTDEKTQSSRALALLLEDVLKDGSSLLDVGAGNGEYLKSALDKVEALPDISLTLVEPAADLARQLPKLFSDYLHHHNLQVFTGTFADFASAEHYDVILASHLFYHVPRDAWQSYLAQMMRYLAPGGRLILVLREQDDPYAFKMAFKPRLFGGDFKALTLDDVLADLPETAVVASRQTIASTLHFPRADSLPDTISIIEFFLNKPWADIPADVQNDALQFIGDREGVFDQTDGVAVITKA